VVVRRRNSEYGENGKGHRDLDWFKPQESKILRPELCVNGEVPSNGALGRLI
jgi:hypothetical protein